MSVITPDAVADRYVEAHQRIVDLVAAVDDQRAARVVPGTPEWTVHDLVAHLAAIPCDIAAGRLTSIPTPQQTDEQVRVRRDRSVPELLEEWDAGLSPIVDGARAGLVPAPLAIDAITHEQDLRGALGAPSLPDRSALRFGATGFSVGLRRRLAEAGLPTIRLVDAATGLDVTVGDGEPAATVSAPEFEIFRAMAGRRSRAQVAAFDWTVDATPFLDAFCVFGPLREDDLAD
jgi:uncharacterized protein (TIGR03083 family)